MLQQDFETFQFCNQLCKICHVWNWKLKKVSQNRVLWEFFFQKINLSVVLNRWNVKTSVFFLSWKAWFWEGNFGQKHTLNLNFYKESVIISFQNASGFESERLKRVWLRTQFFWQPAKLRIKISRAGQISKQPSLHPSEYESRLLQCIRVWSEIVCRKSKFIGKLDLKNQLLWIKIQCKNNTVGNSVLSWNTWFWERCFWGKKNYFWFENFKTNQTLNQLFYHPSDFESKN